MAVYNSLSDFAGWLQHYWNCEGVVTYVRDYNSVSELMIGINLEE